MDNMSDHKGCGCMHHKFIPLLVIAFALLFLLNAFGVVDARTVQVGWPIIVGLAGVLKLGAGNCKCC